MFRVCVNRAEDARLGIFTYREAVQVDETPVERA